MEDAKTHAHGLSPELIPDPTGADVVIVDEA